MSKASFVAASVIALAFAASCDKKEEAPPTPTPPPASATPKEATQAEVTIDESLLPAFGALPTVMESKDNPITEEKVALGRALYYDKRLSAGKDISCNTCHDLATSGAEAKPVSEGHKGQKGKRNAPTVYNAAGHIAQFWDGRAKSVEEQAKGPITNPIEMAMKDEKAVVAELKKIKSYQEQFKKAFPEDKDPITMDNLAKAIGAFERKLVTPSKWDKFLGGDKSALSNEEKAGFKKFIESGCNACHAGPYLGGAMFQKLGLAKPWPKEDDLGRFEATKQDTDKMFFKVPTLRNVEKTAPYFHDGSVATLEESVKLMGRHQLAKELSDADVASIVTFMKALTGEIPKDYVAEPTEAPGGAKDAGATAPKK